MSFLVRLSICKRRGQIQVQQRITWQSWSLPARLGTEQTSFRACKHQGGRCGQLGQLKFRLHTSLMSPIFLVSNRASALRLASERPGCFCLLAMLVKSEQSPAYPCGVMKGPCPATYARCSNSPCNQLKYRSGPSRCRKECTGPWAAC